MRVSNSRDKAELSLIQLLVRDWFSYPRRVSIQCLKQYIGEKSIRTTHIVKVPQTV